MTPVFELNFDGLVGPTHHYGGLAKGNVASTNNAYRVANPCDAALQGIQKMRFMHHQGLKQAVVPPHLRPNLTLLKQLGFEGTPEQQLKKASAYPHILTACFSASNMWTANMATITPSVDSLDNRVHFTAANLISQLHRHQEADFSSKILQTIFNDSRYFMHHPPLPRTSSLSDEGAANHNRICQHHHTQGVHLFVYGRVALGDLTLSNPSQFPARQTLEASQTIARLHLIDENQVIFAQQNPRAIDLGVFHHDVIGVANESVILIHQDALISQRDVLKRLQSKVAYPLQIIEVSRDIFSIEDAVESYIFNSQLITLPTTEKTSQMLLVAPHECALHPRVRPWIESIINDQTNPIQQVHFFDLKQSMQNGGGPACLRLRVPLTETELSAMHPGVLISDNKLNQLESWVKRHYRNTLHPNDLLDPTLIEETYCALDELTQILEIGSIYHFQHE